jgi:hypothetical protein
MLVRRLWNRFRARDAGNCILGLALRKHVRSAQNQTNSTLGRRSAGGGYLSLAPGGFHRPLSDPSTDLQVRCHGSERTDETCQFPAVSSDAARNAIRSPRRRGQEASAARRGRAPSPRSGNDEVELGRLLDRKIGGLCPPQNLVDQVAGAPLKSMKATEPTGVENSYFS